MRPNLTAVFASFGKYVEEVQEDIYRTGQLQARVVRLEGERADLDRELTEARGRLNAELRDGPSDAAQAICEELSKEDHRLRDLARWPELTPEEREALKKRIAEVIDDARIPF